MSPSVLPSLLTPATSSAAGNRRRQPQQLALAALFLSALLANAALCPAQTPPSGDDNNHRQTPLSAIQALPRPDDHPVRLPETDPQASESYQAARDAFDRGEYRLAEQKLNAVLDRVGGSFDVLMLLAQTKYHLALFGEARLALRQATTYRPNAPSPNFLLGQIHREQQRLDQATSAFRTATLASTDDPADPIVLAAWYELGQVLAERGYLTAAEQALARFDEATWSLPEPPRDNQELDHILRGHPLGMVDQRLDLLHQLGNDDRCIEVARQALEHHPAAAPLLRRFVGALIEAGRSSEALRFCQDRLAADPPRNVEDPETYTGVMLSLAIEAAQAADQLDTWISTLQSQLNSEVDVAFARRLAERLDDAGRHAAAARLWTAITDTTPTDADAAWALAGALRQAGELEAGLQSLINFVRTHPEQAHFPAQTMTDWLGSAAQTQELLALVERLTEQPNADFATHTVLGLAAAAADQVELAERLFTTALEERPDFAPAHIAWGQLLLQHYRWNDALAQGRAALETDPELPAAHFVIAEAHNGLDQADLAEAAYRAAIDRAPENVDYLLALARHYRQTGDLLAAQRYFQEAWSLAPNLSTAVEDLVDCYLTAGKLEIARDCLQQAQSADLPADALRRLETTLEYAPTAMSDEHVAELARQHEKYPDDIITALNCAAGLYLHQRYDDSLEVIHALRARNLRNSPRARDLDEQAMNLEARLDMRRLHVDHAIELRAELVRRYPRRLAALRLLTDAYMAAFRVDEARQMLRRVLDLELTDQQRLQARSQLMSTCVDFGEFDDALRLLDEWIADDDNNEAWIQARQRVLVIAERNREAIDLAAQRLDAATRAYDTLAGEQDELRARLRENADDIEARNRIQIVQEELIPLREQLQRRRAAYVTVAQLANELAPAELRARSWLAEEEDGLAKAQYQEWLVALLLAAERPTAALEVIDEITPRTLDDIVQIHIWRAHCQALQDDANAGVNELLPLLNEAFVQQNRQFLTRVQIEIISLLAEAERNEHALEMCQRWLETASDRVSRVELLELKRLVLQQLDRTDESIQVGLELLQLVPNDAGLNNDIGYTWAERGTHLDQALEMITTAVATEPLNGAYLDSLGWVYYQRGDFANARTHLANAIRLRTAQDPLIYDHLADAAYRLDDSTAAEQYWTEALKLLEQTDTAERRAAQTELLANVRTKLDALRTGGTVPVAPIANDSTAEENK